MPVQKKNCFDETVFKRFLNEQSDASEESNVLAHIEDCEDCRHALEKLAGDKNVWSDVRNHLGEDSIEEESTDETARDQRRALRAVKSLLAPSENPEMMGRIGQYEVCGVIGRGSSGIVVKALDPRLSRFVAIKLLAPVYSNIGSSRRRFEREGRAVASLNNPHVIPIHAVQDFQGTPYIVMQYLPDGSLQQRIDKLGPLSTREVICVGMQVAKGLAAAHAAGIVHRDVKPANVLLESGVDSAMVTDFGLARVVDEATMTRSGSISGTPQYMSPEQARGESVDPRSDLFSLGSVMYAACTGHSPFRSKSVFGVIKQVCDEEPKSIRELNPDIDEWLVAFIEKLQAKDPENRFASAAQVAELLQGELAYSQSPTMMPKPARAWWTRPEPIDVPLAKPSKPLKPEEGSFGSWRSLAIGLSLLLLAGAVAFGLSKFDSPMIPGKGSGTTTTVTVSEGDPSALLALVQQENQKLPRFENEIEATIDVDSGGLLFMRSNLGAVNVKTHDKPTVVMKLKHTVAAKDAETAKKMFKALEMSYEGDAEVVDVEIATGRDAVIVAKFPTRQLTQKEIEAADDLEQLKDALLVRNNSHYRNAVFDLLIPEEFNLDVVTSAGPIKCSDIDGEVKLLTHGGKVNLADVTGKANLKTHGGSVTVEDAESDLVVETHGGHVEIGDVEGDLTVSTHGGHITAGHVHGHADVETLGGHITLSHTDGTVKAISVGGGVTLPQAKGAVQARAQSGRIKVNFVEQPAGNSELTTLAGSVEVGYRKGLAFDINATTVVGKITAPFLEGKKVTGTLLHDLNEGSAELRISCQNGSVKFVENSGSNSATK